jgi:hypothetical protein
MEALKIEGGTELRGVFCIIWSQRSFREERGHELNLEWRVKFGKNGSGT